MNNHLVCSRPLRPLSLSLHSTLALPLPSTLDLTAVSYLRSDALSVSLISSSLPQISLPLGFHQVYLGAYDVEETATHAYDLAALKYWGQDTIFNFPLSTYPKELKEMEGQSREEYIGSLKWKSSGFSRGVSKYRGVARHHHNGRWEARIGRVFGNKYLYLGTYDASIDDTDCFA